MKKLLFAFTLIMSSFFFCNFVSASTFEYTITDTEIGYVSSEDFQIVREEAIKYCKENDMYYRIAYNIDNSRYDIFYYEKDEYLIRYESSYGVHLYPRVKRLHVYYKNGEFSEITELSANFDRFYINKIVLYHNYLDTNIENLLFHFTIVDSDFVLVVNYNNKTYNFAHGASFKSLYDIYNEPNFDSVSNFYTLVIEKIVLLSNLFTTNFTFLFTFVILILIFLIEIIRRYLL